MRRCVVIIRSKNYDPSLPQTGPEMTKEQEEQFARFVYKAVKNALKDPEMRKEYQQWLEEQKGKENNDSNNN